MQEDGNGSNEFRKLKILMLNKITTKEKITLIVILAMGVIIWYQSNHRPEPVQQSTKIDTTHVSPIIINNWQPKQSTPSSQTIPSENISGMDSAKLREMLEKYLEQYRELFAAYNTTNRYDTVFSDSTYRESITMELNKNLLKRFTRNMEVYHRTITIVKPPRFAVLGGAFGYSDGLHTAAGVQLAGQTVKGDVYSVGYDVLNRGWYGSVMVKIRVRK